MVFICKGCSNDPCSLTVNDADFDPLFCPFDQDIDVVKWVPEGARSARGYQGRQRKKMARIGTITDPSSTAERARSSGC